MSFSIEPLSSDLPFGKVVRGLRAHHIADPVIQQQLRDTWIASGVLVFRDGDINEQFHIDLSRLFGPLAVHTTREYLDKRNPELLTLVSKGETQIEVDGEIGEFQSWHKDLIHNEKDNRGGILRAIEPSSRGGLTGFIDLIDAYRRLPQALKDRIEGLRAVYQMSLHDDSPFSTRSRVRVLQQSAALQSIRARVERDFPPSSHPLTFVLPETGQTVLNYSPFHLRDIEGLTQAEGLDLMQALSDHIFDSPAYHHKWSTDEMVLWDNWRLVHMVSLIPVKERRVMQRTTIAGDYGLGRLVAA